MSKKNTGIPSTLKELYLLTEFGIGSLDGEFSFQGTGNYGRGNYRQLAGGLDPATKKIQDYEQSEINQNVASQVWGLGKYVRKPRPMGPNEPEEFSNIGVGGKKKGKDSKSMVDISLNPYGGQETELEEQSVAPRALPGDHFYKDLPAFPAMNTLEDKENFMPTDAKAEMDDYNKDQREKYQDGLDYREELGLDESASLATDSWKLGTQDQDSAAKNASSYLVNNVDHFNPPPQDEYRSPGGTGVVIAPKDFIPDDWETKKDTTDEFTEDNFKQANFQESNLTRLIEKILAEEFGIARKKK